MLNTTVYPKVLVVCESPFSLDNGFGVTLTSFFQGWPSESLGIFYMSYTSKLNNRETAIQANAYVPARVEWRYALPMLLGNSPEWRGLYSNAWLHKQLKSYKPDLVYSFFHSESTMNFGAWIADRLHVPHIIHAADDGLTKAVDTIRNVQKSLHCIAISDEMANEYQKRYGRDFKVFRNGASSSFYPPPGNLNISRKKVLTIRYLGRLYSWLHYDSLRLLGCAIEECRQNDIHWKLELYGTADIPELYSSGILTSNVSYNGQVGQIEGINLLQTADLLTIPLTYDENTLNDYKFSFPTKLSEFLATGKPILLLSSPLTASSMFCKRHNVGKVIDTPSHSEVVSYLTDLWHNPSLGQEQGIKNISICRQFLDMELIRSEFHSLLATV
jgi:hypothetical protein